MPALAEMKRQGKPITALTAYDYATSRLVDEAGIDMILVGDSLAMVVLGHDNTLAVTVDEMLHHTRAVRRAVRRALVVADMPFGSYHGTVGGGRGQRGAVCEGSGRRGGEDRRAARGAGAGADRG
jgi:3-methyl-2-oxobutanoate hydroxymethyltransferase